MDLSPSSLLSPFLAVGKILNLYNRSVWWPYHFYPPCTYSGNCADILLALMWYLLPCRPVPVCLHSLPVRTGCSGFSPLFCYLRTWLGKASVWGCTQSLLKSVDSPPSPEMSMNFLKEKLPSWGWGHPSLPHPQGLWNILAEFWRLHSSREEANTLLTFHFHLFIPSSLVRRD